MSAGKSCAIMVASALMVLVCAISTLIIVGMLATLPGHLDEFLLTNDEYCYPSVEHGNGDHIIDVSSKRKGRPSVQVDYGEYEPRMVLNRQKLFEQQQQRQQQQQQQQQQMPKKTKTLYQLLQHVANPILRRISLHLWEESTKDADPTEITACPIHHDNNQQQSSIQNIGEYERHEEEAQVRKLHPMCEGHRKFRSRLRFQQLLLPWNWYYRNQFRIRGLSVQSLAMDVAFESSKDDLQSPWWKIGWDIVSGRDVNSARVNVVPRRAISSKPSEQPGTSSNSLPHLPPSLEIDSVDISFQSWKHPVVSTQMNGIVMNVVIQKGGFPLQLQKVSGNNRNTKKAVGNSTALLIGDMTIPEVLEILPRPPELEGLYPRIGVLNITNVTLCVYEIKNRDKGSLKLLLKMRLPDKFFMPIANLTLAHQPNGIDRKHFQPMMESSISNALRERLLREATAAFRNSWVSAHKAQGQIQSFVLQTQELYLDRWIGMGVQAWHQTQENVWQGVVNGTAPLMRAVEDWVFDLKEIVSEPVPPLVLVLSHHWNRTMDGMNKYGISIDKEIWGHINELVAVKMNQLKHEEKKISKHLEGLREAFDGFIAKSGQDLQLLVKSCELEVKDMWLQWHRQFMPEI